MSDREFRSQEGQMEDRGWFRMMRQTEGLENVKVLVKEYLLPGMMAQVEERIKDLVLEQAWMMERINGLTAEVADLKAGIGKALMDIMGESKEGKG